MPRPNVDPPLQNCAHRSARHLADELRGLGIFATPTVSADAPKVVLRLDREDVARLVAALRSGT